MQTRLIDPLIGQELDGYLIEELLGQGGMTCVYRAVDVRLHRYAAVKVLVPTLGHSSITNHRFEVEARAVARLKHPHIVAVHRFNQVNDVFYLAMEYIDGADLRWILRSYRDHDELMDYQTMLTIMGQVADALDYAHQQGIVHRDVKPANIMINRQGNAILTDFNLARILSEDTAGEAFGTPHYISPEQAVSSAEVVPQSDLYSLGVILYEILTGDVPFTGSSVMLIAAAHIGEPFPDPRTRVPELCPAFVSVLECALAKEPEDRYRSGEEFSEALRAAVTESERANAIPQSISQTRPADRITYHLPPQSRPAHRNNGFESLTNTVVPRFRWPWVMGVIAILFFILGAFLLLSLENEPPSSAAFSPPAANPSARFQNGEEVRVAPYRELAPAQEAVQRIVWSADGKYIAGAGSNGNIMIWDAGSGQVAYRWQAHEGAVNTLAWRPDGSAVLVSGGADHLLRVWKVDEITELTQTLDAHSGEIVATAWSADGSQFISGDNTGRIIRWDDQWAQVGIRYTSMPLALDWSRDSTRFVAGSEDYGVRIWDLVSGLNDVLGSHQAAVRAVDWGPADPPLVAAVSDDGDVRVWRVDSREYVRLAWGLPGAADVRFNHNGTRVAVAHDTEIGVWDTATANRVAILSGGQVIRSIDWSPDGAQLVAVTKAGLIRVWVVPGDIPDRLIAGEALADHEGRVNRVAWDESGEFIATGGDDGALSIWDATRHEKVLEQRALHNGGITALAWMPGSGGVVTGGCDGNIMLVDMDGGTRQLAGHAGCVSGLAFSQGGQRLWSVDTTGQLLVWNLEPDQIVLLAHESVYPGALKTLMPTDGSRFAGIGGRGDLLIWEYGPERLEEVIQQVISNTPITAGDWNPFDQTLLTGDAAGRLRTWNAPFSSGANVEFSQLQTAVTALDVSRTGQYIAGIDQNGCLTLWTVTTAEKLSVQCGQAYRSLEWNPTRDLLVTGTEQGDIVIWYVP